MDETIAFDGVKSVVAAPSSKAFLWAISDGGDQRYGRIFYNASALISAIPYHLGGDRGLIIALRLSQVVFLVAAYVWLAYTLLTTWPGRLVTFLSLSCLPFTSYYLTQPKPEPVQLLAVVAFISFAAKRRFSFGWHWAFLGLAFGAKISVAPLCAMAAFLSTILPFLRRETIGRYLTQTSAAIVGFLVGWVIAVPLLLVPTTVNISTYLHWTFLFTGHGLDDSTISARTWLHSLLGGEVIKNYISSGLAVLMAITGSVLAGLALLGALSVRERWRQRVIALLEDRQWVVLLFALSLLAPILFNVRRLWGFYLHPGEVLATGAILGLAEEAWITNAPQGILLFRRLGQWAAIGFTAIALLACYNSAPRAWNEYKTLAKRTSAPLYQASLAIYKEALPLLNRLSKEVSLDFGKTEIVSYDPVLFMPDSRPGVSVQPFWGPFRDWQNKYSIIVMSRDSQLAFFLGEKALPPSTSAYYADYRDAVREFQATVSLDLSNPLNRPYVFYRWLGKGAGVLLRRDLAQAWGAEAPNTSAADPSRSPDS